MHAHGNEALKLTDLIVPTSVTLSERWDINQIKDHIRTWPRSDLKNLIWFVHT